VTLKQGGYSVASRARRVTGDLFDGLHGVDHVGETKTCTVTNNDVAPKLIVIKHVINDNGGTAIAANFTMSVTATSPSPASFPGAEAPGTQVTLKQGGYSVGESGPSGYAASYSTDCTGSITVGETKTCTVTNDDNKAQPGLGTTMSWILLDSATLTACARALPMPAVRPWCSLCTVPARPWTAAARRSARGR
jgi:hypothetical protein